MTGPGESPALAMPPTTDLVVMVVAIAAISTSGPIIAATAAPALAIAFWRNAMSAGALLPLAAVTRRRELAAMTAHERWLGVAAGAWLAAHFATWVPSLTYTSVSSAAALGATQPIWAALMVRRRGHHIPARGWVGIVVAVVGAALITGVDVTVSARALAGDALALAGGVCVAAYMVTGNRLRQSVSTTTYTTVCYLTTALLLLVVCVTAGRPLTGYSANAWLKLVALTVGAQFLGHSLFNRVLRTTSPTVVSMAVLFEVPGATLIAAVWLHQRPHVAAVPGLLLLLVGVGLVIAARDRSTPPSLPVE